MREGFKVSIITFVVMAAMIAVGFGLIGVPRLLSDDPCLRDWDIECTSAGVGLEIIDLIGTLLVVVATRVIPIVLVIVVAAEAVTFRKTAKLRPPGR